MGATPRMAIRRLRPRRRGALACSSGSLGGAPDAGRPDSATPPPLYDSGALADAALPPGDALPPPVDAGPDVAPAPTDAGTGCAWDGSYESPACSACLRARCCGAVASCEGDPACVALEACVNHCAAAGGGDSGSVSTCAQQCADTSPAVVRAEWQGLSNCVEFSCANQGAGPCL